MPAAASSSVIESGRSRTPVSIAESPSATERNSGTAKNSPACSRYWKKNEVSPPRSSGIRRIAGSTSGSRPARAGGSPRRGRATAPTPPPRISQITGDRPSQSGASGFGLDEAPRPRAQDAEHDQAEAERRERGADEVEPHLPLAARRPMRRASDQDHEHDEDLAGEHVAPREVGREEAADERADRDRDRARRRRPGRRRAAARRGRSSTRPARRSPA